MERHVGYAEERSLGYNEQMLRCLQGSAGVTTAKWPTDPAMQQAGIIPARPLLPNIDAHLTAQLERLIGVMKRLDALVVRSLGGRVEIPDEPPVTGDPPLSDTIKRTLSSIDRQIIALEWLASQLEMIA